MDSYSFEYDDSRGHLRGLAGACLAGSGADDQFIGRAASLDFYIRARGQKELAILIRFPIIYLQIVNVILAGKV